MRKESIVEYFEDIETTREYDGYMYSVEEAISIVVLGSLCGLRSVSQIHQWADNDRTREFLKENFAIERIPCYFWLLSLLKLVKPESLNRCVAGWIKSIVPEICDKTIAVDGKTVCSTQNKKSYASPLHIISAQISELGMTLASRSVDGKSNEIPAVQALLREMDISGCLIVADALNCQKETAKVIVGQSADYLLNVKLNQPTLMEELSDYVQDDALRGEMQTAFTLEKNRDRIERRTAFVTRDISWLSGKADWAKLVCIGGIHTEFETVAGKSSEWHYYISSRALTAQALLHHARMEWAVEAMHWLLDVHYDEDSCRIDNINIQQNLNMLRKLALSLLKRYKANTNSKKALSKLMFDCLLNLGTICRVLRES